MTKKIFGSTIEDFFVKWSTYLNTYSREYRDRYDK